MWQIYVLGEVKVCHQKTICEDFTSQESLLLGGLALAPQHSLTRAELVELLWSDEDCPEHTGHRLRQILFKLKDKLRQTLRSDALLVVAKGRVALRPDVTIDAAEFEAAMRTAQKTEDWEAKEEQFAVAIRWYGGQLLSQHLNLFQEKREQLNTQYGDAQRHLAECRRVPIPTTALLPQIVGVKEMPIPTAEPVVPVVRRRPQRAAVAWLGLAILAGIIWAGTRTSSIPTVRTVTPANVPAAREITAANVSAALEELQRMRVDGTTAETETARRERLKQHAELTAQLLEAADAGFVGPEEPIWQDALQTTTDSQKEALQWCLENDSGKALQISSVMALHNFRQSIRGDPKWEAAIKDEGRQWLDAALARSEPSRSLFRARALRRYIIVTYSNAKIAASNIPLRYAEKSLEICREQHAPLKDETEARRLLAFAMATCGQPTAVIRNQQEALKQYREVLKQYHSMGDKAGEAQTYLNMAHLGALVLPKPDYWTWNAGWARNSLHLFREAKSSYGIQRALNVYKGTMESMNKYMDARFVNEKMQWNQWLMEDLSIELQRAESANPSAVADLRNSILELAVKMQDKAKADAQILWFQRHWNRFRSKLNSKEWATMAGYLLHLKTAAPECPLSDAEKQDLIAESKGYLAKPILRAAFEAGSKMSLAEAAEFVAKRH